MTQPDRGIHDYVSSADVNRFLQEISGSDCSAKDFRTWAGSVFAMSELRQLSFASETEAKKNIVATVKAVAERLGNAPAVCRKFYIHPALLEAYMSGTLRVARPTRRAGPRTDEAEFLRFLKTLNEKTPT